HAGVDGHESARGSRIDHRPRRMRVMLGADCGGYHAALARHALWHHRTGCVTSSAGPATSCGCSAPVPLLNVMWYCLSLVGMVPSVQQALDCVHTTNSNGCTGGAREAGTHAQCGII